MSKFAAGSIRFWLGLILMTSGLCKLTDGNFPQLIGPPFLEKELAAHGLGLYARFVAFSQVGVGFLLLSKRFATLGAVMSFPILLNILVVVISLQWRGTPYVVAFLLACNAFLFYHDFHKLKFIFTDEAAPLQTLPVRRKNPKLDIANLCALAIIVTGASLWRYSEKTAYFLINTGVGALAVLGIFAVFLQWRKQSKWVVCG
ncbi:MAG: hypothetical protein MUD08_00695 [Cytophagales bacterium]|jgi:hypothetical protein|nr:hypothetical protein [Cytophagales bacterium]